MAGEVDREQLDDVARAYDRVLSLRRRHGPPPIADFTDRVRRLVVIGSSSRGGSTIFAELLRQTDGLLHLRAEINPFLRLTDLCFPASGTSDRLVAAQAAPARVRLGELLFYETGHPVAGFRDAEGLWSFAVDLACRLTLQWPRSSFEPSTLLPAIEATLARLARQLGWRPDELRDVQLFHAAFLAELRRTYPEIDPWLYDIAPDLLERYCGPRPPQPLLPELLIEEPPFVALGPWSYPTADDLERRPLVIKTPSNAYRLDFFQQLFHRSQISLVHLVRNVAASVNGLYDAWRSAAFFSHRLSTDLRIGSYSECFPWGSRWWKLDLPPGWERWTARPLHEVCAFQWRSAHESLLAWREDPAPASAASHLALRFEEMMGAPQERRDAFDRLSAFLGLSLEDSVKAALDDRLPPLMATSRPRQRRWFERAALLQDVLQDPANIAVMERLGYELDPSTWI
jgi:hypothetical protein